MGLTEIFLITSVAVNVLNVGHSGLRASCSSLIFRLYVRILNIQFTHFFFERERGRINRNEGDINDNKGELH